MPEEVEKDESVITERVEDIVARTRSDGAEIIGLLVPDDGRCTRAMIPDLLDRIEKAHNAEMKEVIDLLQKALDVCWKAECYFRWLNEQKKEGKANA